MKKFLVAAFAVAALACALAAPAVAQNTSNYTKQGGAETHVGGKLVFDAGGLATSDKGAVTANSGNSYAVTSNAMSVMVTTDSLSTAAAASRTITITDSEVTANSLIQVSWAGGTNTAGTPVIEAVPTANTITITLYNKHASTAFSGTFVLHVLVL